MKHVINLFISAPSSRKCAHETPALLAIVCLGAFPYNVLHGNVRTEIPDEFPGPPAYTQIQRHLDGRPFVFTDGEWVAIPFWRYPVCVPPEFNLLDLFDPPPRPFNCPLTVNGFAIWKNGPATDPGPELAHFRGLGSVPVWFVRWSELQAAAGDYKLTITELASMPSLRVGNAEVYTEVFDFGQALGTSTFTIVALGTLTDGSRFHFSVREERKPSSNFNHIRIEFK